MNTVSDAKSIRRRQMMLEAPIIKVIPKLAFPMVISMLIDAFYNLADTYFVSQIGTAATAAVGVNHALMQFIRAVAMFFGMGGSSYMSRLLGAKRDEDASRVASTVVFTGVGALTLMSALLFAVRGPLVTLLGATETSRLYSMQYATYILLAVPFTAGEICLSQTLRAEGSTTYSMLGMVSGCFVNLVLDPLFIFVFDWEVAGAAAATAISKAVSFCVLLIPFVRKKTILKVRMKLFTPTAEIYMEVGRTGVPAFLRSSVMSVATVVMNNVAGGFGDSVLAATSVSSRVMMVIGSAVVGFGQGYQPVAGYCWGAKRYRRVIQGFWTTSMIGVLIALVSGPLLYVFAPDIVGMFTQSDEEIINIGAQIIRAQSITTILHIWVMIINGLFQALGRGLGASVIGLSRQVICLIPCVLILPAMFDVGGLVCAQAVADVLSMLIAGPMLVKILLDIKKTASEYERECLSEVK